MGMWGGGARGASPAVVFLPVINCRGHWGEGKEPVCIV